MSQHQTSMKPEATQHIDNRKSSTPIFPTQWRNSFSTAFRYATTEKTESENAPSYATEFMRKIADQIGIVIEDLDPRKNRTQESAYDPIDLAFRITDAVAKLNNIRSSILFGEIKTDALPDIKVSYNVKSAT